MSQIAVAAGMEVEEAIDALTASNALPAASQRELAYKLTQPMPPARLGELVINCVKAPVDALLIGHETQDYRNQMHSKTLETIVPSYVAHQYVAEVMARRPPRNTSPHVATVIVSVLLLVVSAVLRVATSARLTVIEIVAAKSVTATETSPKLTMALKTWLTRCLIWSV